MIFLSIFGCKKGEKIEVFGRKIVTKNHQKVGGGKLVIFLRPDSVNFYQHKEEGIYEADSDFGFAIQNTMDSVKKMSSISDIKFLVTTERFIEIADCKNGPITIDRDSIFYGVILTAPEKNIEIKNGVMSGNSVSEIEDFFSK